MTQVRVRSWLVVASTLAFVAALTWSPAVDAAPRSAGRAAYVVVLRTDGGAARARASVTAAAEGRTAPTTAILERAADADAAIDALQGSLGFTATHRYRYALQGFSATIDRSQVAALRLDARVASVTLSRPMEPTAQSVPLGVQRVGAAPDGAAGAADIDVDVAIIDTGVGRPADPTAGGELNAVGGVDCTGSGDPDAWQDSASRWDGHGTHVAGTVGARDNGIGVVGVAPGARLWSVKVFDAAGGSTSTVLCGLDWVVARRIDPDPATRIPIGVINMSLRGPRETAANGCDSEPEHAAVCSAVAAGISVVVAAGNEGDDVDEWVPARYPEAITVSAISDFDGVAGGLSTQGSVSGCIPPAGIETDDAFSRYSNRGDAVDIAAPGTCVRSTRRGTTGATHLMSGTSMATPHVAGAVARYLALHPDTPPDRMQELVVATASYDWAAFSDPDASPDRLLDVDALLEETPGVALWSVPRRIDVGEGVTSGEARLAVQRLGGFEGPVRLSVESLDAAVGLAGEPTPATLTGLAGLAATTTVDIGTDAPEGDHPLVVAATADGLTPASATVGIRIDRTPPAVGAPWPSIVFRRGTTFGATAAVRLDWAATDGAGPVVRTELQRAGDAGPYVQSSTASAGGYAGAAIRPGEVVRFRVRATDGMGNTGLSSVLTTRVRTRDSSGPAITWSGGWRTRTAAAATGDSLRSSGAAGAQAALTFVGRAVAWVAALGKTGGKATVLIDGTPVATIDLKAGATRSRRVVYASRLLEPGRHDISVRVITGRVDVDAFLVLE